MQNLKLPTLIKATYKIITPMFIGDAEQNATRIAPQSVKGALRFWWRALVWDQIIRAEQDEVKALNELHHQEAILFGSSATNKRSKNKDECYGKGLVSIRVKQNLDLDDIKSNWPISKNNGSFYLSYGLTGDNKKDNSSPHRSAIHKGTFDVILSYYNLSDKQEKQILDTIKVFGLFGGLGGRARRGLGSVQLIKLNERILEIKDRNDHLVQVKYILDQYKTDKLAPFSTFNNQSRVAIGSKLCSEVLKAHNELGDFYKNYRKNTPAKLNKAFGLPLKVIGEDVRRSSPTLFHVSEYKGGKFVYSILFLKTSIFSADPKHQQVNYKIIDGFLDLIGGKA